MSAVASETAHNPLVQQMLQQTFAEIQDERGFGILPIIRHYYERWDGAGYPDGLRREIIPLPSRSLRATRSRNGILT